MSQLSDSSLVTGIPVISEGPPTASNGRSRPLNQLLKMAVVAGVETAVQLHIERGDDLNGRDSNGLTPLMLSAARNKAIVCKLLLDAGADDQLLAPSGKTALAIAVAAGAQEAAAILNRSDPISIESVAESCQPAASSVDVHPEPSIIAQKHNRNMFGHNESEKVILHSDSPDECRGPGELNGTTEFDLSGWEAEEDLPPPLVDPAIARAACELQATITTHEPFDSSIDWDDIDAFLPERASPLLRSDDAETAERLRLLLLRAVREGSVPNAEVKALSSNDDEGDSLDTESILNIVLNDLGAEVDERIEYAPGPANYQVFIKPEATPEEEELVASALVFIENLASHRTEPLRIYQKEFQRQRLISAQEEVLLGQAMESGLEKALDALSAWSGGIARTLAAGELVKTGQQPLSWMSRSLADDRDPRADNEVESGNDEREPEKAEHDEIYTNGDPQEDLSSPPANVDSRFYSALSQLAAFPLDDVEQGSKSHILREALFALRLNLRFLLELVDRGCDDDNPAADRYADAINSFRRAWERMAVANLKLVFHHAKKFRYSGEPLDDLTQEGNLGLLKAVERFDWRRGYKFSTYATWWIRQHIGRHVADKCRTVRIPVHVYEKAQRLGRESLAFESEMGRSPRLNEIALRMEMPAQKVAALQRLPPEPMAMDDFERLDEMIAVEAQHVYVTPDPMERAAAVQVGSAIDWALSTLTPKEEQILRLRFGLGVDDALTLDDVGIRYGVTRERIRQIEAKALRKLRHPTRGEVLALAVYGCPVPRGVSVGEDPSEPQPAGETSEVITTSSPATRASTASTPSDSPLPSAHIEKILAKANELGVAIDDDRQGSSRRLWVHLDAAPADHRRKLVRTLIQSGFEFWPGKGYWR